MSHQIVWRKATLLPKSRFVICLAACIVVALGYAAFYHLRRKPQYDYPVHSIMIADCGTTTPDESEPKWSDNIQATFNCDSTEADLDRALGRRVRIEGTLGKSGKGEAPVIEGEHFSVGIRELSEHDEATRKRLREIVGKPIVVEGCLCKAYLSAAPIWLVPNPRRNPDPRVSYLMALPTGYVWFLRNIVWEVVDDNEANDCRQHGTKAK